MRAISLWEPWATLMALGIKRVETRSWFDGYVGRLAIHAARRPMDDWARKIWSEYGPRGEIVHYGLVVCTLRLDEGILSTGGATRGFLANGKFVDGAEFHLGDYSPGRYAWITSGLHRLENPFPWTGHQRWFEIPDDRFPNLALAG